MNKDVTHVTRTEMGSRVRWPCDLDSWVFEHNYNLHLGLLWEITAHYTLCLTIMWSRNLDLRPFDSKTVSWVTCDKGNLSVNLSFTFHSWVTGSYGTDGQRDRRHAMCDCDGRSRVIPWYVVDREYDCDERASGPWGAHWTAIDTVIIQWNHHLELWTYELLSYRLMILNEY